MADPDPRGYDPEDADHDGRYDDAVHHANDNVQLLLDDAGVLVERYEYGPYGERTVYISPGSNDPDCHAPTLLPQRVQVGGIDQPYGICEFGHQGLMHDDVSGLIYNRARMLHPRLQRFMQRDPLGYVDGVSMYEYVKGMPVNSIDPLGTRQSRVECLNSCHSMYGAAPSVQKLDCVSQCNAAAGPEAGSSTGLLDTITTALRHSRLGGGASGEAPIGYIFPVGFVVIGWQATGEFRACCKADGTVGTAFVGTLGGSIAARIGNMVGNTGRINQRRGTGWNPSRGRRGQTVDLNNPKSKPSLQGRGGGIHSGGNLTGSMIPCETSILDSYVGLNLTAAAGTGFSEHRVHLEIGTCSILSGCQWTGDYEISHAFGISPVGAFAEVRAELNAEGVIYLGDN